MVTAGVIAALALTITVGAYRLAAGQTPDATITVPALVLAVLAFSLAAPGQRHTLRPPASGYVVAVIPAYNEDPAALRATIDSLLSGTRIPHEIHVIDDGSDQPIPEYRHPRVFWYRQANSGKRRAQALALRHMQHADYVLTVDSDCTVDHHALERLLEAMSDPRVQAATGLPLARNRHRLLPRIIDLEIASICLTYRAARSMLGSLTTCSGALTLYRAGVILDNLDDYAADAKGSGDDRRLTHYAMLRGRVVSVSEAIAHTDMPTNPRQLYRQRIRWSSSHWRYMPWELANLPLPAMLWSSYYLILSIIVPAGLVWALAIGPMLGHGIGWQYLAYWIGVCWLLNIKYAVGRPHMTAGERVATWLLCTPALVAVHLAILRPAMIHALFTLRTISWGTRAVRGRYRLQPA